MNVADCMTTAVKVASPDQTICDAAQMMRDAETGFLPVQDRDELMGMITDRDIAVRAVAERKGPDTPVREVMSPEVLFCYDDEDLDVAAERMSDAQVRRLPVLSRDKRLVGVISLGDLAQASDDADATRAAEALTGVTEAGGQHVQ